MDECAVVLMTTRGQQIPMSAQKTNCFSVFSSGISAKIKVIGYKVFLQLKGQRFYENMIYIIYIYDIGMFYVEVIMFAIALD